MITKLIQHTEQRPRWIMSIGLLLSGLYAISVCISQQSISGGIQHVARSAQADPIPYAILVSTIPLFWLLGILVKRQRVARKRIELLFDNAVDGIYIRKSSGELKFVNKKFEEIHGVTRDQVLGKKSTDLLELSHADLKHIPTDSASELLEAPYKKPDGTRGYIQVNISEVQDEYGATEVIGIVRDITKRKLSEERLAQIASFPEQNPNPIIETDLSGIITYINPAANRNFPDLNRLKLKHRALNDFGAISKDLTSRNTTLTREIDVGDDRYAQKICLVKEHNLIRFFCFDITSIRRAEESLRFSDEVLKRVNNIIIVADREGKITYISPSVKEILGYEPEALLGDGWWNLSSDDPEERKAEKMAVARAIKGEAPINEEPYEREIKTKDGENRWILFADAKGDGDLVIGVGYDITERKTLELQLLESEARYRALIENASDLIFSIDLSGNFIYGNRKAFEISGYEPEELIGKSFTTVLLEDDWRDAAAYFKKLIAREEVHLREYRLCCKDGSIITVEINSRLIEEGGEIAGIESIGRDITEKKAQERERELLLSISNAIKDSHSITELAKIATSNVRSMLDVPIALLHLYNPKRECLQLAAGEGLAPEVLKLAEMMKVGPDEKGIAVRTAFTRELMTIADISSHPLVQHVIDTVKRESLRSLVSLPLLSDNELQGVFQVVTRTTREFTPQDIQLLQHVCNELALGIAHKQAEADLAASESKYRDLVSNANDGIYTLDRFGRFTSFNHKSQELTGYSEGEIVGQPYSIFLLGKERSTAKKSFVENLRGRSNRFELTVTRKDGSEKVLEISTRPMYKNNEIIGNQGIARDITARKELDRMKTEFISTVSHELRTPLTSIKGYTDLIYAEDVGPITDEQKDFLGIISQNTTRLTNLINDLLDIERLESQQVKLEKQKIDIRNVLDDVANTFRVTAEKKHIQLLTEMDSGLIINGDPDRMTQVFANLVSNAIKYTREGHIWVRAQKDNQDRVIVSIQDSGIGISPDEAAHVFDKFFRSSHDYTREVGGTGLGLAIVKTILEQHGGSVGLESKLGEGSTFTVNLPLYTETSPPERIVGAQSRVDLTDSTFPLVLIIEDEPDIGKLIANYIEKFGYRTNIINSGLEGVEAAKSLKPDLITLDILLPDIDGFDTLSRLKGNPETREIPVVFLSIVQDKDRGFQLGASAYLTKPIEEEELKSTLTRFLHSTALPILIVDDDADYRELMCRWLEREGYQTEIAADGDEALRLIQQKKRYQLILLDKNMPKKSGLDVLLHLRSEEYSIRTPVIMISGSVTAEEMEERIEVLGAESFLSKGLDIHDIVAEVVEFIERRSEQTEETKTPS